MAPTESSLLSPASRSNDSSSKAQASTGAFTSGADPLVKALQALELQRPEETVALARARLQADPTDAFASAVLGVALCQTGHVDAAVQALERAHYLNPHDARILYNYGLVLEAAGRPAAAKIRYYAALKLSPRYPRALKRLFQPIPETRSATANEVPQSPSVGLPLELLRLDDFHSDWTDGVLPKPPLRSWRSPELPAEGHAPTPLANLPEVTLLPQADRCSPTVENARPTTSPAVSNLADPERRRVAGSIVLVQALAFSLLIGAITLKLFWPSSSSADRTRNATLAALSPQKSAPEIAGSRQNAVQSESQAVGASYRGAQMVGADLRDRSLANADFEEANLSRAILVRADLHAANFAHASLPGADLRNASLVKANLLGALLRDADLRGTDLRNAYLKSARFSNANLSTAWLTKATLSRADLRQAILQRAQLPNSQLQHANLSGADLRQANLQGANLQDADLTGANLRGANLNAAKLTGALYDRDTRWPNRLLPGERGARRAPFSP